MVWSQTQLDDGARIGRDLGLPSVFGLVARHGGLSTGIPLSIGLAVEVFLADQGLLDIAGPGFINLLLAVALPGAFAGAVVAIFRRTVADFLRRRFGRRHRLGRIKTGQQRQ